MIIRLTSEQKTTGKQRSDNLSSRATAKVKSYIQIYKNARSHPIRISKGRFESSHLYIVRAS